MKLDFTIIQSITNGAERIFKKDGLIHFFRFSEQEEQLYLKLHPQFIYKTFHTAGISLDFETDASVIKIDIDVTKDIKTSTYFSLDIFSNDSYVGSIKNFNEEECTSGYDLKNFLLGEYHGEFKLGKGTKAIRIVFPWSVVTRLKSLELDNASYVFSIKKKHRILAYGDSITHGFHSMYASNTYTSKLASALNAHLINKAIGAEVFFPELAKVKSKFNPDIVTIAYGTNDWVSLDKKTFADHCKSFLRNIRNNYPSAQMIVITPIWRADHTRKDGFSDFFEIDSIIREINQDIGNIIFVKGIDLVPHDTQYFGDGRIHPNDKGFDHYAANLINYTKEILP